MTLNLNQTIERMKAEIMADVKAGVMPATVKDYSELHDFTDANLYGLPEGYSFNNDDTDLLNAAQDAINAWIAAGGITEAVNV